MKKLYFAVSFTNPTNVPASLKWANPDNQTRFKGIETPGLSGEKVSLENLFSELEKNGLFIQSGFAQKKTGENKMFFTMIKFQFGGERKSPAEESLLKSSFLKIFQDAFWNIKVFGHDGDVTVACSRRTPRFEGNDRLKPVTIWDKDLTTGERVGDKPKPIQSEHLLCFEDGQLVLYKL